MTTPPPDTITTPTRCISCAYTLTGLPRSAICPECATPCRDSFPPVPFEDSPSELRTLASSLRRLETALHILLGAGLATLVTLAIAAASLAARQRPDFEFLKFLFIPAALAGFLGAYLFIFAVTPITRPIASSSWLPNRVVRAENAQSFLRAMLSLFTVALFILTALTIGWFIFIGDTLTPLIDATLVAISILSILIIFSTASYLREIALRIPDHPLAMRIITSARAVAACYTIAIISAVFTNPLPGVPADLGRTIQTIAWPSLFTSVILTAIPLIYFTLQLRRLRKHTLAALRANNPPA